MHEVGYGLFGGFRDVEKRYASPIRTTAGSGRLCFKKLNSALIWNIEPSRTIKKEHVSSGKTPEL